MDQNQEPKVNGKTETGTEHLDLPEATAADLPDRMRAAFEHTGWQELMPVQKRAIPYIMLGRDMMIQSRTGSGKTGAYLLPTLERINPLQPTTQALVLVPTRELAVQVGHEAEMMTQGSGVRTATVYGGVSYGPQLDAFRKGAHLVVGTPGRVLDHLLRRALSLEHLEILVFDEADRMMSMGFYPDMVRVQSYLPRRSISSYMFSATFPMHVMRLANRFLVEPGFLNLSSDHVHVTETEHVVYEVPSMDKDRSLVRIIEMENPASALIFCNTKVRVTYVKTVLERYGYDADEISSDLSQVEREKVMARIRQSRLRFLVATDVAARGIDLPELSHVFMYEAPEDPEAYIHRAGRTGRAGGSGVAISLVNPLEKIELTRIAKRFGIDIQNRPLPTEEQVQALVNERVITLLEANLRTRDRLKIERMQRFMPLIRNVVEQEDEMALLAMLVDDYYQATFHAPLLPPETPMAAPVLGEAPRKRSRQSNRSQSGGDRRKR